MAHCDSGTVWPTVTVGQNLRYVGALGRRGLQQFGPEKGWGAFVKAPRVRSSRRVLVWD